MRKLEGQGTLLGRTMHDLAYDPIHDEIVVSNPFMQAVLIFRGGADGEEPPLRVIQGPRTRIVSDRALDKLAIDPVHGEIFVATSARNILVFPREANGDVEPIRVLGGPESGLSDRPSMRVDPVRDLLFVSGQGGVMVFDREASGNARPRLILGPRSGHQFEVYPPSGQLITHRSGSIEGWSIEEGLRYADTGEAGLRPLWRVNFDQFVDAHRTAGAGLTINPIHREVMASIGASNTVWTFSVPEAFETGPIETARASR